MMQKMGKFNYMLIFPFRLVAVNKFRENKYDVILLDLDMPIVNGYEACKLIRQEEQGCVRDLFRIQTSKELGGKSPKKRILLLAVSALVDKRVIEEGMA